jgi:hypothetical protein
VTEPGFLTPTGHPEKQPDAHYGDRHFEDRLRRGGAGLADPEQLGGRHRRLPPESRLEKCDEAVAAPMAPAFATARVDELRVIARAPDQAGVRGFAEGQPEPKVCSGLDESLMQVFHGLDEVGMPEDEVQGLGLLDSDCPQLHVASATASCSPWHSPASRYRRHGLPTQRPRMGRAPLAACPGSVESHDHQGSIGAPKTITTRPERIKEVDDEIRHLGVTVLSQWAVLGPHDFVSIVEAPDVGGLLIERQRGVIDALAEAIKSRPRE